MEWFETGWKTIAVAAAPVLVVLDGIFGHFRVVRTCCRGLVAVARYLRDLFLGPIKVRKLEDWKKLHVTRREPVYHLGAVWLPSDVEADRYVAYCQYCWAEDRKITLDVHQHSLEGPGADYVRAFCRYDSSHGAKSYEEGMTILRADYLRATEHAYDRRKELGA